MIVQLSSCARQVRTKQVLAGLGSPLHQLYWVNLQALSAGHIYTTMSAGKNDAADCVQSGAPQSS